MRTRTGRRSSVAAAKNNFEEEKINKKEEGIEEKVDDIDAQLGGGPRRGLSEPQTHTHTIFFFRNIRSSA